MRDAVVPTVGGWNIATVPNSATRATNLILFVSHLDRRNHPGLKSLKVSPCYGFVDLPCILSELGVKIWPP